MNLFGRPKGDNSANSDSAPSISTQESSHKSMVYYFGGLELPYSAATNHNMLIGTTGAGKTLQMRMSLLSVILPALREGRDVRTVLANVKQDEIAFLTERGVSLDQLIITLPFDARGAGWDIWRDAPSRDVGLQIASLLIPEGNDANRYFSDAARDLLNMVIGLFIDREVSWELADLINAFTSLKILAHVFSHSAESAEVFAGYQGSSSETAMSVFTTARTHLAKYEAAAALWKRAKNRFSLGEFLKQRGKTLVLGNYQTATYAVGALNRLLLQRLTELTLGLPDVDEEESDDPRRIFFFLDELQRIGGGQKLDFLVDLLSGGRSRGASCTMATQGLETLRCVYSENEAETLMSMAGNIGVLRVSGTQTPDWASKLFGEMEIVERMKSGSVAHAEHTTHTSGWSESFRQMPLFLPGFFRTLPSPKRGKPLKGVFSCSSLGAQPYVMELPSYEADERLGAALNLDATGPNAALREPNFVPWSNPLWMKLNRWNEEDYARLKLKKPEADLGMDAL